MKTTTEMQLVPITKLVPYVNNARTHSPEQITKPVSYTHLDVYKRQIQRSVNWGCSLETPS